MNVGFTSRAQGALERAVEAACEMGHTCVGTEHILLGLIEEGEGVASRVLADRGVTAERLREIIEETSGVGERTRLSAADLTPRTKKIIENSASIAVNMGHGFIGTEHLLLAITAEPDCYAVRMLSGLGVSADEIRKQISSYIGEGADGAEEQTAQKGKSGGAIKGCPTLSAHGVDLCRLASEGKLDPTVGREEETDRVIQILSRRTKNNPCLIGEPGVGKTAVVEGLAQRIVEGNVPDDLRGKSIVTLDISSMIAGAKYRGEFEERMKGVMKEVLEHKNVILFIDEIHTIIGAGGAEGAVDAANIIKPALARGQMQVIGATTIDEYRRHIEKDAALERRFQSVMVGEPTPEEAEKILFGLRDRYEAHHKLRISDEAIRAAVKLSVRYIPDRFLPDKAIDLIDEASSKKRIAGVTPPPEVRELEAKLKAVTAEKEEAIVSEDYEKAASLRDDEKKLASEIEEKKSGGKERVEAVVTEEDIADIVSAWTHIPVKKLEEEESEKLMKLEETLKARVIGQDEAVGAVARAIRRGRLGLGDPKRPIGSFIFLGPTGVGKTELSKVLADVMFGDENAMIRVDMSEYMEKHSVSKLIGSPPGYVGYDDGGQLTEKIRRRPYSVVLFDEIEKAHPDVFNILLQILEDGILTDSQGRRVDFKNTIIIMTSNVGASGILAPRRLGFTDPEKEGEEEEKMKEQVTEALKATFKPEFLNRLDEIIIFNKLTDEDIKKITAIMLRDVEKRVNALDIGISFTDGAIETLAKAGFDPVYGARPLRRAIVRLVEDAFSEEMLTGKFSSGDSVVADAEDGKIVFRKVEFSEKEPAGEK